MLNLLYLHVSTCVFLMMDHFIQKVSIHVCDIYRYIKIFEKILIVCAFFFFFKDAVQRTKMVQLADLFSVPEMGLLCNVTEYFLQNHIDYHPEILFRDVKVNRTILA